MFSAVKFCNNLRNVCSLTILNSIRSFQTSSILSMDKFNYKSIPKPDEGTQGEKIIDLDSMINARRNIFPDETSNKELYDGVPYDQLPICNIKVSSNNTILTFTDHHGTTKLLRSCGVEGFKNTRKGTNVAAQATAITLSTKALERGFRNIRVRVRGLGPGRMSAIKGLEMGGLNIISVTDNTRVSWNPPRPRKAKRL